MAWATVLEAKGVGGGSAATVAVTLSAVAFAAGDFVVVMWEGESGSIASATITDNSSGGPNTWAADLPVAVPGPSKALAIWSTTITHGGASLTFTVTPNISAAQNISVHHYASPGGAVSLESASSNFSTVATVPIVGSPLTIATGPDLVVAFADNPNIDMTTPGTGFTLQTDLTAGADYQSSEDQLNVTSGVTPDFASVTTSAWVMGAAAYQYAAAPPTTANDGPPYPLLQNSPAKAVAMGWI